MFLNAHERNVREIAMLAATWAVRFPISLVPAFGAA
jgi:hypothetical protein